MFHTQLVTNNFSSNEEFWAIFSFCFSVKCTLTVFTVHIWTIIYQRFRSQISIHKIAQWDLTAVQALDVYMDLSCCHRYVWCTSPCWQRNVFIFHSQPVANGSPDIIEVAFCRYRKVILCDLPEMCYDVNTCRVYCDNCIEVGSHSFDENA